MLTNIQFRGSLAFSRRLIHTSVLRYVTVLLLVSTVAAQTDADMPKLDLGKPIERELVSDQAHSYSIALSAGQYLHVVVDQRGIDVVVAIFGADGKKLAEVDSPNGTQGPEPLSIVAQTTGTYRLEVRSLEKDAALGRYEVKIEELRTAVEQDKNRIAAERALMQAELLRGQGTAESLRSAIKKFEEAVPLLRAVGDKRGEAATLNKIGVAYDDLGEKQNALNYYGKALPLIRAVGDRRGEAATLNNIGAVYDDLGEKRKALDYFGQALLLRHAIGDHSGEAATLDDIGNVYSGLGEKQKALDYYAQALPLIRAVGDRRGEAATLNGIGMVYGDLGEKQKALDYYAEGLLLIRAVGDRRGEAAMLSSIGMVYIDLGESQKALDYFGQALPLQRVVGDRDGEAATLVGIGAIYNHVGEKQEAIDYYGKALPLFRAVGDRRGEAITLTNIGAVYNDLGENQKALDRYEQALPLIHAIGDPRSEAATLNGMGRALSGLGESQKALNYYAQALPLFRAVGDRSSEAMTLNNIGADYDSMGETQKALDYYGEVLPLIRVVGDKRGEAVVLTNLMKAWQKLAKPQLGTFYGKQSVNIYQQLRSNIQGLDKDIQKTYLRSVEQTYRDLAEMLITQGRSAEAQQVLNTFKDQQFFDFDQTQARQPEPLTRTPREAEFGALYQKTIDTVGAIGGKLAEFKRTLGGRQPNDEEARQLQQLEAQLKTAVDASSGLLKETEAAFSQPTDARDKVPEVRDTVEMQATLRQLSQETGQKAVAVYQLLGQDHCYALLITPDSVISVSSAIKRSELDAKALQLWALLQSADYDPTILAHEVYNIVFKPLEDKLPKATRTIIWSLDGNLRYLPVAALYDGRQYLVERFNHVVFTRADKERLTRAVSATWTGYGFATSAPHKVELQGNSIAFGPLDFGKEEMEIFRTKSNPNGIFDGDVISEAQFTKSSLLDTLKQRRPLIHISSHFRFRPGDAANSFLLLGDNRVITLAEMKEQRNLFQGVELLTLSACETAAQRPDATGKEVDGFAELAQRLGAGSVLASLWSVSDKSTAELMKAFYRNRQTVKYTKAEALRQAQLDLLYGRNSIAPVSNMTSPDTSSTRGKETLKEEIVVLPNYLIPFKADKKRPFAHPYYWAPFVLFGNWK